MVSLNSVFYGGTQVQNPSNIVSTSGTPTTKKGNTRLGYLAVNSGIMYGLVAQTSNVNTWVELGGTSGAITSVSGTSNQITVVTTSNAAVVSLPSAITAPGSLTTTTSLAATTTITAGTGITATTGNIAASSGNVSASGTVTGGTGLTATTGNITATAGNLVVSTATDGLVLPVVTASGAASGTVTCNGRVGSVTFSSVSIASNSDLTLTLGNSSIASSSSRLLFSMSGATTGSALSVKSVTPGTGTCAWVVTNGDGAAIVTSVANITFDFIVLN